MRLDHPKSPQRREGWTCLPIGRLHLLGLACYLTIAPPLLAQSVATLDSAGITIVENRTPKFGSAPFMIGPRPLVQIGSVRGDDETDFGPILSARLLPGGQVAVVELHGREIRLFDGNTGAFVRSIGREGQGPGEFGAAPTIAASEDGGIWAWDPGNRRLSLFATEGRLRSEHRLTLAQTSGVPSAFTMNAWHVSTGGAVLSTAGRRHAVGNSSVERQRVLLIDRNNDAPIGIGQLMSRQQVSEQPYVLTDPFVAPLAAAMVAGEVYVGQMGSWQVNVYDADGQLLQIIRCAVPRSEITPELRAQERASLERRFPGTPALVRLFDRLELADSTSAIKGIKPSSDGTIWVLRWHPRTADGEQVFDVIDVAGQWLGTLRLPFDVGEVADVSASRVLTIWRDSLDVPYLRVYRLSAGAGRNLPIS